MQSIKDRASRPEVDGCIAGEIDGGEPRRSPSIGRMGMVASWELAIGSNGASGRGSTTKQKRSDLNLSLSGNAQ